MPFSPDTDGIEEALGDLEMEIALESLWSRYKERKTRHKMYRHIKRKIDMLKAEMLR